MAADGNTRGRSQGLGEPGLDDALGDPHPDEVAEEAADGHQDADLPEGGSGNAETDDQGIAQGGEETDESQPNALALQEVLHVAELGLLDLDPMFNPVERCEATDHVVGRSAEPVAEEDPEEGSPLRPSQCDGCAECHLAAHRNATSGNEAAQHQTWISPGQYFVHWGSIVA